MASVVAKDCAHLHRTEPQRVAGIPYWEGGKTTVLRFRWICLLFFAIFGAAFADSDPVYALYPAVDYPVLGVGAAAGIYELAAEWVRRNDTIPLNVYSRADLPGYDAWAAGNYSPASADVSTVLAALEVAAPVLWDGAGYFRGSESFYEAWTDMVLYGEALSYSCALSLAFKSFAVHPRPLYFSGAAPLSVRTNWDTRSGFFSTHTTAAFAAAVFTGYTFQLCHPNSPFVPWVWGGMLGTAAGVAALRVASGEHFPTDVAMGAAVGALFGYAVPRLHLIHHNASNRGAISHGPDFFSHTSFALQTAPDGLSPVLVLQIRD